MQELGASARGRDAGGRCGCAAAQHPVSTCAPFSFCVAAAETFEGICYIETMNLDGETNLKIKKAMDETKDLIEDSVGTCAGTIRCEPPNSRLYQFTGGLRFVGGCMRARGQVGEESASLWLG